MRRTIRTLEVGSREYVRQMRQIRHLDGIMRAHNNQLKVTHINLMSLKGLANAFNKYWPMVMGTIGALAGVAMGARRSAQMFAEFEDQIADVMKVTGLTRDAVIELNEEFKKVDTRTTQESLMELAWVAGKLGIEAKRDILGFVDAANKITVALAKDLGGSAEEAVRQIGKLTEIFNLREIHGIEGSMLRTASAINELGMASTAQERSLINFAYRVGGIAPVAGVSIQNILGLGATLDILGQKIEVSSTAYSRVMTTLARDTEIMARLAGMSMREFSELFREDANEAMLRVFEGVGKAEGGMEALVSALGEAGLEGQRLTAVLGALTRRTDLIREQQELANKAFAEGDSVIKEYNIKNENAQAILERKQKDLANLRRELGERLMPVYMGALSIQERYLASMVAIVEWIFKHRRSLLTLIMVIGAYQVALRALFLTQRTYIISSKSMLAVAYALQIAFYRLTGSMFAMKRAMVKMRWLGLTNPWIAATAAVAALGVAIYRLTRRVRDHAGEMKKMWDDLDRDQNRAVEEHTAKLETLVGQLIKTNKESEARKRIVGEINRMYPDVLENIDAEKASVEELNEEWQTYLENMHIRIRSELLQEQIKETGRELDEVNKKIAEGSYRSARQYNKLIAERISLAAKLQELKKELETTVLAQLFGREAAKIKAELIELEKIISRIDEKDYEFKVRWITPDEKHLEPGVWFRDEWIPIENERRLGEIRDRIAEINELLKETADIKPVDPLILDREDFSELKETLEKYKLKEQFLQGELLGGWEEYQRKRDQIELRFIKGRLKQADEDGEEYLKLRGQKLNKEIELLRDQQSTIEKLQETAAMHDVIKVEEMAYEKRLREHGLFHKGKLKQIEDMTKEEHAAYLALEEEHQENIRKIYADLIQEDIERRVNAHELKMMQMEVDHMRELSAATDLEKTKQILARYIDQQELERIRTHEQAKRRLKEIHAYEEREANRIHLEGLMGDLLEILDSDKIESIIKADKVLSDEEKRAILESIAEIKKALDDLDDDDDDDDGRPSVKRFRGLHFDIFGFWMDDWENLFNHMEEVMGEKVESFAQLFKYFGETIRQALDPDEGFGKSVDGLQMMLLAMSNVWQDIGRLVSNISEEKLRDLEEAHGRELDQLRERYELGLISEEYYQDQRSKLESKVERERARHARDQARRDRNIALFQAIVNTAAAVVKALPNWLLAGIVAAAGALQVGIIRSTPLPRIPGAEGGGFLDVLRSQDNRRFRARHQPDKRGWVSKPTVVTGEDGLEYVLPKEAIENPTIRPFVDMIEMARVSGNLPTLDMRAVAPAIMPGRSSGGMLATLQEWDKLKSNNEQGDPAQGGDQALSELLQKNLNVLNALEGQLAHPIRANVSLTGRGGFYEADEKYEQLKKNVYL